MMRLFHFLLVILFAALQLQGSRAINTRMVKLEELCDDSNETQKRTLGFRSIENVRSVLGEFEAARDKCPEQYHESLVDLKPLIEGELLKDVCSMPMYYRIANYHEKYISIYSPEKKKDDLLYDRDHSPLKPILPVARQFFILFVQQISNICKRQLVERIEAEVHSQMSDEEFKLMERVEKEEFKFVAPNGRHKANRIDDLMLIMPPPPPEEEEEGRNKSSIELPEGQKLYVQIRFSNDLKLIHDSCKTIFKPIGDELFRPVVLLNNLGYWDTSSSGQEDRSLQLRAFRRWYPVIEACEALKDVEVIVDTSSKSAAEDLMAAFGPKGDKNEINRVKFLSREEAEELRARIEENINKYDRVDYLLYQPPVVDLSHKPQSFGNTMIVDDSEGWKSAVRQFDSRVNRLIKRKTDWFLLTMNKIKSSIIKTFQTLKKQIVTRDQNSMLGKLSLFLEMHEKEIAIAMIAVQIVLIFV